MKEKAREIITTVRKEGLRAGLQKFSKKFLLGVFLYYLVRDVTLYILIPYWISQKI